MIPFSKLYIKYSYLETQHKSKNVCYDVFSLHNKYTLFNYPSHNLIIKWTKGRNVYTHNTSWI